MTRAILAALWLALALPVQAQQFGFQPPPGIAAQDEGTPIAGRTTTINCLGSTISCAGAPVTTITISGGAGSANVVEVSIALGTSMGLVFTATVTGQAWVSASSIIVCSPFATSADGQTVETYFAAHFDVTASNRVAGTGFDLTVASPYGATGIFRFHCTGA